MTVSKDLIHARDRYLSKGIQSGGAVALASVLYYESRLNPGSQGYQSTEHGGVLNPHGAYGIPSLNGPRQKDLLDYATAHNLPVDHLDTQLDFVLTEIANSYPKSWAAIRSSASYQSIVPIIVDEYENPRDKPKEINGALVIAAALASLPAQQVPPAPVPQGPAPKAPPIILPVPAAPAGLPPISSTSAGRVASAADTIMEMRDARIAELISDDPEIAAYDEALAAFGKLEAVIVPAALPKPAAKPAETTIPQQRNNTVLGPNWITSIFGVGTIGGALATIAFNIYSKQTIDPASVSLLFTSVMTGFGLIQAKDKNVTGGTISNVTGLSGPPISLVEVEKQGALRQPR
jgi:hypothetical protein